MVTDKYILKGTDAVPATLMEWAEWFETAERRVARTEVRPGIVVSTVFLGVNHRFSDGPLQIFETMTFVNGEEDFCDRYATWAEAELGHMEEVERRGG